MTLTFGQTLRAQRLKLGKPIKTIASEIGLGHSQLGQIELGRTKTPRSAILERLAAAYEIPYETLMRLAGYPPKPDSIIKLPEFIRQAGGILSIEDWEPIREIVAHMVSEKTTVRGQP